MKIAFVGKGGSGKTTVSALFSLYIDSKNKNVGLFDVDVNSHTAEVLGIVSDGHKDLSEDGPSADIRRYLAGTNPRVNPDDFLNSTPPGNGSGIFTLDKDNYVTKTYGQKFGHRSHLFTIGSYKGASIGIDCHHSTQYIAENLLSHTKQSRDDVIVIDSVAGNDTFGNTLYMQDLLVFIVKPEREGLNVFRRFYDLAEKAGVADRVYVVGNQVISDVQRAFLEKEIPSNKLLGILTTNDQIIDRRLADLPLDIDCMQINEHEVFDNVYEMARQHVQTPEHYYNEIVALHRKLATEGWVVGSYHDHMENQIDPEFGAV
jgi:CO dehydrogenase maturation factor